MSFWRKDEMPLDRREITDAALRAMRPPERGHVELWDSLVPQLAVRVLPSGGVAWSVRARQPGGKRIRASLGRWPAVTVKQARIQAKIELGKISAGGDPVGERRAARQAAAAARSAPTVSDRLAEWQAARQPAWSERYATEISRLCDKVIGPKLGDRPLAMITREDWTSLISTVRKQAPATATWVYSLLSSFFGFAESHGWIAAHPLPRKGAIHIAPRMQARERTLSDSELVAIWTAAEAFNVKPRAFVRVLIMTALREREAADLSVSEVDLMNARITLPPSRTKNRPGHVVPLHPLLIAELQAVWPDRRAGPGYKLLGRVPGGGFAGFSRLKRRLDAMLPSEMKPWVWHDLRRSARSTMARLGVPALHAECALNHVSGRSQLEKTYLITHFPQSRNAW
jgi:integrase